MGWFTRKPRLLPLALPALDMQLPAGADPRSFAAQTIYQMGYREAFEPEAHDVVDLLIADVLSAVVLDVTAEDEPYLKQLLTTAAQIGAGIGLVERRGGRLPEHLIDRDIEGALRAAVVELPKLPPDQHRLACFLIRFGHYAARNGAESIPAVLAGLRG